MTEIIVATWGEDLASGFLRDVGHEAGLLDGHQINIEIHKDDIVISKWRPPMTAEQQAHVLAVWDRILERKAVNPVDADS